MSSSSDACAAAGGRSSATLTRTSTAVVPTYELDVSRFYATLPLVAVRVPTRDTSNAIRALRTALLDLPRIKPVATLPEDAHVRLVLLHQSFGDDLSLSLGAPALAAAVRSAIAASTTNFTLEKYQLKTGYEQLSAGEALAALLPAGAGFDVQTAFEVIGHIAHVNLRDELRPYGALIGRVLLDKNIGTIRTVINKTGVISSEFRTFPMEVLAGDGDTQVDVRHCGARFRFDFRDVYWNSRLQHEHELLVKAIIPPASIVADGAAGVGPFAVPLAKCGISTTVFANDLNPASHAALADAVARNGVAHAVTTSCGDARAFFATLGKRRVPFTQAIFNLPATALELCDVFVGLFARGANAPAPDSDAGSRVLPRAHIYCFARASTNDGLADEVAGRLLAVLQLTPPSPEVIEAAAVLRAAQSAGERTAADAAGGGHGGGAEGVGGGIVTPLVLALRGGLFPGLLIRAVRNVAPAKHMMCVSFEVPRCVALAPPVWAWGGDGDREGGWAKGPAWDAAAERAIRGGGSGAGGKAKIWAQTPALEAPAPAPVTSTAPAPVTSTASAPALATASQAAAEVAQVPAPKRSKR